MEANNRSVDGIINDMNYSDFECSARQNRQAYVPMTKWGIKYDNENGSLSVSDFVESVTRKATLYRISDYELYENFGELLGGNPLIWYRAFKDRYATWPTVKYYFIKQFTKPDNDYLIERQLQSRLQQPGESFGIYYACMELLFKKLSTRKSDASKLEYLIRNLDDFYLNRIQEGQIRTIDDLAKFCEGLERSREILRRRRLSQFPLAEPSLQGRVQIPRNKVNEVRFDDISSDRFDFVSNGSENLESYSSSLAQNAQNFPSVSNQRAYYQPNFQSQNLDQMRNRFSNAQYGDASHCHGTIGQSYNAQAIPQQREINHCSQFSEPVNNGAFQVQGQGEAFNQAINCMQSVQPQRGIGCSCSYSAPPVPSEQNLVSVGNMDGTQFSPMMNECAAIREFSGKCFNCKSAGHHWRNCQQPKRFFCHRCGLEGKSMHSCPNCSGNREAGART